LQHLKECTTEEMEKALAEMDIPPRVFIKQPIFNNLREIFGKDLEISISN